MENIKKIAVLTSGLSRGSNFKAIYNYLKDKSCPVEFTFLLITEPDAPVSQFCLENNIKTVLYKKEAGKINDFLQNLLSEMPVDLIVLAGFMRKLSSSFLNNVKTPVLNIHPALLPLYGGKGMFGHFVHEAVFNNKDTVSGATVHLVNSQYDKGDIILQEKTDISHCQSPSEIASEVLKIEHKIYAQAIELLLFKNK